MKILLGILLLIAGAANAAESTRDGGTASWMCCTDKACAQILTQKAEPVTAFIECGKLVDADKVPRYYRSQAFKVTPSVVTLPAGGSVKLTWTPPIENTDGSALTNLVGYTIVFGNSPTALSQTITLTTPSVSSYIVDKLTPGTWYFSLEAVNAVEVHSARTSPVNKVLP